MLHSAPIILTIVAGGLFVVGILKPMWPITAVAGFILSVAVLVFLQAGK
jgi:hypothetical protein